MEQLPIPPRRFSFVKILATVLFIVLPFLGFWLGMEYEEMKNRPSITIVRDLCDINNDKQCNDTDKTLFQNLIGECGTGNRFNSLADANHDGCITLEDQQLLFPEIATPSPTPDKTANWKTYRNEEYGFELKYPPHWNYKDSIELSFVWLGATIPNEPGQLGSGAKPELEIAISQSDPSANWNEIYFTNYSSTTYNLNAIKATMITGINKESQASEKVVIAQKDHNFFLIQSNLSTEAEKYFDHILSTFRFVDEERVPVPTE